MEAVKRKQAIIVLGMHRSGTSAMARTLALAGAALPQRLMIPTPENPAGYWEPQAVADFNDQVLAAFDSRWDDTFGPRRKGSRKLAISKFIQPAREIIRSEYGESELIVFKEPRVNILLELWQEALRLEGIEDSYVIMLRRPDEIVQSLVARDGMDRNKALLLWTTYMVSAEAMTRNKRRVVMNFDLLLEDAESALDRVEEALAIELPNRSWRSVAESQRFLQSELRHHKTSGRLKLSPALSPIRDFFEFLQAMADGRPGNDDVPGRVANWLGSLSDATGSVLAMAEFDAAIARRRVAEIEAEKEAQLQQARVDLDAAWSAASASDQAWRDQMEALRADAVAAQEQAAQRQAELDLATTRAMGSEEAWRSMLATANAAAADAQERALQLEADLQAALDQGGQLQAAAAGAEERALQREADLQAALDQGGQVQAAAAAERAAAQAQMAAANAFNAELKSDLDAAQTKIAESEATWRTQFAAAQDKVEVSQALTMQLRAELDSALADASSVREGQDQLQAELEMARSAVAASEGAWSEQIKAAVNDAAVALGRVTVLQAELQAALDRGGESDRWRQVEREQAARQIADSEARAAVLADALRASEQALTRSVTYRVKHFARPLVSALRGKGPPS